MEMAVARVDHVGHLGISGVPEREGPAFLPPPKRRRSGPGRNNRPTEAEYVAPLEAIPRLGIVPAQASRGHRLW
eukprot:5525669-Pyramimonas_sp.AAC.1